MIIKNFFITLRRFKLASGLNIVGLSVAFAALILILMQVSYENGFDKGYPHPIYRVQIDEGPDYTGVTFPRAMCDALLECSPAIAAGTLRGGTTNGESYISIERDGVRTAYFEWVECVYPDAAEVFGFEFAEGDPNVFEDHTKLALPQSLARKFFGRESAVGRMITFEDQTGERGEKSTFEVGAVYRDFPANSSLANVIRKTIGPDAYSGNWTDWNFSLYVTLVPGADPAEVAEQFHAMLPEINGTAVHFTLMPIQEVYYDRSIAQDPAPKGSRATVNLLLAIAVLVIGIAAVNFVNFATSLTPLRIKGINTRKVLGSSVGSLRAELVFESVGIALLSFVLGLGWVALLRETGFDSLISGGISFSAYGGVIGLCAVAAVVVGFLAGLYPALYTTSFPPAWVLKGSFGLSPRGRRLRTALIGFQFVVSLGLIVAAVFLRLQNSYFRNFDTGMDLEQVAVVMLNNEQAQPEKKQMLVNELRASSHIEDVAFSLFRIGLTDQYMQWVRNWSDGRVLSYNCIPVSWNFLRVMGLQVVEGRDFTEDDDRKAYGTQIFNQTLMRQYGLTLEDRNLDDGLGITGVVRDFNFASLRNPIAPLCLFLFGDSPWAPLRVAYIKIKGDPYAAVEHIKRTMNRIDPVYPVDVEFFDTAFDSLYRKERKLTSLITFASLLAVLLSLTGVFGLVSFETQYRRKEIGVRRVLGATVAEMLVLFNRRFLWIVLASFAVAAPLAGYGVREWLSAFVYRIPLYGWVFAVSLAVVLFITLLTVTIQSWRSATADPVDSLKNE